MRSRSLKLPSGGDFLKRPTPSPRPASPEPSHVSLFLTNLRLLLLNTHPDWPVITTATFTTKDSQQNIKHRISCVEWALYQLFSLFDPAEAQDKLAPYFPPVEPIQSIKLRAALYTLLDKAKKEGLLGKDAVLRKTMLDECKGERLEEVLSVFSTAVLKRCLEADEERHTSIAQQLAFQNFTYRDECTELKPLILAHRVSLTRILEKRKKDDARFRDFEGLLKLKQKQITRRREHLKVLKEEDDTTEYLSKAEIRSIQEKASRSWYGSNEWLDELLHGNGLAQRSNIFAQPYEKVWKHVEEGSLGDVEELQEPGLLQHLEERVRLQKRRVEKWRSYQADTRSRRKDSNVVAKKPLEPTKTNVELLFEAHQDLQVPTETGATREYQWTSEQLDFFTRLKKDLDDVSKPKRHQSPVKQRIASSFEMSPELGPEPDVELAEEHIEHVEEPEDDDEWVSEPEASTPTQPQRLSQPPVSRLEQPQQYQREHSSSPGPHLPPPPLAIPRTNPDPSSRIPSTYSEMPPSPSLPSPPAPSSPIHQHHPDETEHESPPEPRPPTPSLADKILLSVAAASPSPVKPHAMVPLLPPLSAEKKRHVLSLAERTRMSMHRASRSRHSLVGGSGAGFGFDESDNEEPTLVPKLPEAPTLREEEEDEEDELPALRPAASRTTSEDLLSRTRASLSNMTAISAAARLERRRSTKLAAKKKRESFMPVRPLPEEEEFGEGQSLLEIAEQGGEVGYEDVFRSRPKVKLSPPGSPVRGWVEGEGSVSPPSGW
jgi:hypothetical protein